MLHKLSRINLKYSITTTSPLVNDLEVHGVSTIKCPTKNKNMICTFYIKEF